MATTHTTQPAGLAAYNAARMACKALGLAATGTLAVLQARLHSHANTVQPTVPDTTVTNAVQALAAVLPAPATATTNQPITVPVVVPPVQPPYVPGSWFAAARGKVAACSTKAIAARVAARKAVRAAATVVQPITVPVVVQAVQPIAAPMPAACQQTPVAYKVQRYNASTGKPMPVQQTYATLAMAQAAAHAMRFAPVQPTIHAVYATPLAVVSVPVAAVVAHMPTTLAVQPAPLPTVLAPVQATATVQQPKTVAVPVVPVVVPPVQPTIVQPVAATGAVQWVVTRTMPNGRVNTNTYASQAAAQYAMGLMLAAGHKPTLSTVPVATTPLPAKASPSVVAHATASVPVVPPVQPVLVAANAAPVAIAQGTVGPCSATHIHSQWVAACTHLAACIAVVGAIGGYAAKGVGKVLQTAYVALRRQQTSAWANVPTPTVRPAPLYTPTVQVPAIVPVANPPQSTPLSHTATLPNGTVVHRTPIGGGKVGVAAVAVQPVVPAVQATATVAQPIALPVAQPAQAANAVAVAQAGLANGTLYGMGNACKALGLVYVAGCGGSMATALTAVVNGQNVVPMPVVPAVQPTVTAPQATVPLANQQNPAVAASLAVVVPVAKQPSVGKLGGWQGHSVVAVVRFLGAQGWGYNRTATALATLGITVAPATIRTQLQAGSSGHGNPAPLTQQQHLALVAAAGQVA